jgi:hypothetical protein
MAGLTAGFNHYRPFSSCYIALDAAGGLGLASVVFGALDQQIKALFIMYDDR